MPFVRELDRIEINFGPLHGFPKLRDKKRLQLLESIEESAVKFLLSLEVSEDKIVITPHQGESGYRFTIELSIDKNGVYLSGCRGNRLEIPRSPDYQILGYESGVPAPVGI